MDYKVDFASPAAVWNLQVLELPKWKSPQIPKLLSYLQLKPKKLFKAICLCAVDNILSTF